MFLAEHLGAVTISATVSPFQHSVVRHSVAEGRGDFQIRRITEMDLNE